jgi:hypothetical protein
MAKTSNSSLTPYATPADMLLRFDANFIGELVRDDAGQSTPTQLLTDPVLINLLTRASGKAESIFCRAERYSPVDLQALTGNSVELLKDIVCVLAIEYARFRRGQKETGKYPLYDEVLSTLQDFADGNDIFPFIEVEAAGLPGTSVMQPADFFNDLPTLLTEQSRAWGIRQHYKGLGGGHSTIF